MIKILHNNEVGKGLEYADGALSVKAGRNVTVDAGGVHVDFPAPVEVPTDVVSDLTIEGNQVVVTLKNGTVLRRDLPAVPVDVKFQSATFADGKLKVTLSDGTETETDFNAEVIITALEQADVSQKQRLAQVLKDVLKGEEVQDFAGNTKGYLLAQ